MSVDRPTFSEGQVLGAADLEAIVTHERFADVLHERTEHLWGVAQGLTLQAIDRTDASGNKYVDVNLLPGRAVDRLGRTIVVDAPRPLETADFTLTSIASTDLVPVFVYAIATPRTGSTQPGKCSTQGTTRITEGFQISFGRPGSEIEVLRQDAATVDESFGNPGADDKVLVGWVMWDATLNSGAGNFVGVATSANGIGVRFVGVVASDVVALGGTLGLRTRPNGNRFAVTVAENSTGGAELRFGKQDGQGPVSATFTVDDKGNVAYTGTLSPAPVAKTMAESGVVFDGVRLPLPVGITEDQVTSGKVRLHVVLTPVVQPPQVQPAVSSTNEAFPLVIRCSVDPAGDRRVACTVRWYDPSNVTKLVDLPSTCTYLIIATGT